MLTNLLGRNILERRRDSTSITSSTTPTTWLDSRETEGLGETEGRKQILLADLRSPMLAL